MLVYQHVDALVTVSFARSDTVKAILAQHPDVQIIVADDGLQHYRLAHGVETIVIDGMRRFGNDWWLPTGPMRERAGRLKLVDAIVISSSVPRSSEIPMHLLPGQAVNLRTGMCCDVAQFEHVVVMAGIGRPSRSFAMLRICGVQSEKCVPLTDYQFLNHADVSTLISARQTLVTIKKDMMKCRILIEESQWHLPVDVQFLGDGPVKLLTQLASLTSGNQLRCGSVRLIELWMSLPHLSLTDARNLHLAVQGPLNEPCRRASLKDISATTSRMSLLQIDIISIVARSPYLVFFNRLGSHPAQ